MDKLNRYRNIIQDLLRPFAEAHYAGAPGLKNQLVFDRENDHYLVLTVGWDGETSVRDCIFHLDIADGKIWVQEDNSDSDIASLLIEAGVPKKDIVLGFQSPAMQKFTPFAMA